MMRTICLLVLLAFFTTGCAAQRSWDADAARTKMLGLGREDVLACMGIPKKKEKVENTEVWSYLSTNGKKTTNDVDYKTPLAPFIDKTAKGNTSIAFGDKTSYGYSCTVNIVMKNDRVSAVHYVGNKGDIWTPNEQCGYAVENCVGDN